MTKDIIRQILNLAVNAPSGDNSQPWIFRYQQASQTLFVLNTPQADNSIYNFRERGSYVSHGALIKNIELISPHFGFKALIALFPDSDINIVAKVNFDPVLSQQDNSLLSCIEKRATNRKPYLPEPLSEQEKTILINNAQNEHSITFKLLEDNEGVKKIAEQLCFNEQLLLENYHIHKTIFSTIRWTAEEELKYRTGLYIKTFELQKPQEKAFKAFRHWSIIKFLGIFGVPRLVAKDTRKLYATSAAFGLITMPDYNKETFVRLGMVLQNLWIKATELNISLQPTAAMIYLHQRISEGDTGFFTSAQINKISSFNQLLASIFRITEGKPGLLFRLGHGEPPTAHSLKKQPVIKII